jgi:post-segregation antitoxin (ccd killing protein)
MKVVRVTISLPTELVDQARAVDINISHACRAGLEARLANEAPKQPYLARRVEELERHVHDLIAWRNQVKG